MRQSGMTKPAENAAYEVHRRYIDVFILTEDRETVLWNRLERMEASAYPAKRSLPMSNT